VGQGLKTASIVVVEDNPADVLPIRKALQERSIKCELTCFKNGETALRNLSQKGRLLPDLILLDLELPTADGVEVLGKIRGMPRFSEVPIVILTSSESPSDKQRTARMGAARYIRKPSRLEDFLREVGTRVEELLRADKVGVGSRNVIRSTYAWRIQNHTAVGVWYNSRQCLCHRYELRPIGNPDPSPVGSGRRPSSPA